MDLPEILPGHWANADGQEMAERYAGMTREQLTSGHMSDMAVAFQTAMIMRDELMHEGKLAVAKDRIRWLSVQLAIAKMAMAEPGIDWLAALAKQVHHQANGPSAWGKLTDAGRFHYVERMRQAWVAAQQDDEA